MNSCIEILTLPSSFDSVRWSADGEIAVAGGEAIDIRIPKLSFSKTADELENARWHDVRLQVNLFTAEESPYILPFPLQHFSIGDEQSTSHVVALAWSPPKLARNGRCALAVLTANHVLSIWASEGDHRKSESWKRVLVVNHCLSRYVLPSSADVTVTKSDSYDDQIRRSLRCRIRNFTWQDRRSHGDCIGRDRGFFETQEAFVQFTESAFLAIANDNREIFLLRINRVNSTNQDWSAKICCIISVDSESPSRLPSSLPLNETIGPSEFATDIAWSPWMTEKGSMKPNSCSIVAYIHKKKLWLNRCVASRADDGEHVFQIVSTSQPVDVEHLGPLRWTDIQPENDRFGLVSFSKHTLMHILVTIKPAFEVQVTTCDGDHVWNPVSGVAFSQGPLSQKLLVYAIHSSTLTSGLRSTQWPLLGHDTIQPKPLPEAVTRLRSLYSDDYHFNDKVSTRLWGLDISPAGDYLAVHFSFLPTHSMYFQEKVTTQSFVLLLKTATIAAESTGSASHLTQDLSVEGAMFSILRWMRRDIETDAPKQISSENTQDMLTKLLPKRTEQSLPKSTDDIESIRSSVTEPGSAFASAILRMRQCLDFPAYLGAKLFAHFDSPDDTSRSQEIGYSQQHAISKCICTEVLNLPPELHQSSAVGRKINFLYEQLHARTDSNRTTIDGVTTLSAQGVACETCTICDAAIQFESIQWARCQIGHQFARCTLTLLSIQAPGIARSCGLCCAPYLKQDFLQRLETSLADELSTTINQDVAGSQGKHASDSESDRGSLVSILLTAFDACILCGAKLVG